MSYTVYKHTSPNGKVYIGITCRAVEKRWEGGKGYTRNEYFFKAILKYGWDNFKHEILFTDLTKEQAEQKEIELIALYDSTNPKNGYNLRLGGSVCTFPPEIIEKMRKSHLGKTIPEEQRQKISLALKGRKPTVRVGYRHSEETKRRIGEKNKGLVRCEEQKKLISANRKGKCVGGKNPKAKQVVNLTTGETFGAISEASRKYKLDPHGIIAVCRGDQKKCGGFIWAYVLESEVKANER